ncbi:MAG: hypothetical protein AABY53_03580 [Bdellovibrionota bacterium]
MDLLLTENRSMTPEMLLKNAIDKKSYSEAIRLISSITGLQTKPNILACARNSELAFDLLRFVPKSRAILNVINIAAEETRYARLIVEDIPEARTARILKKAIDSDLTWAEKFKKMLGLSDTQFKVLLSSDSMDKKKTSAPDKTL